MMVGKGIVKSGKKREHLLYAASQNDPPVMVDLPEGTTLSSAINHTFTEVGVYPSVTFK